MKISNWTISKKVLALVIGSFIVFSVVLSFSFNRDIKGIILTEKQAGLSAVIDVAYDVVNQWHRKYKNGMVDEATAKKEALAAIKVLRYGPAKDDYFWVNDGHPKMIMHPLKPSLDGKDVSQVKDPNGVAIFMKFARVVREKGAGFVGYHWASKTDSSVILPKSSYLKGFKPWGWIIGSGVYINEVDEIAAEKSLKSIMIIGFILLLVLVVVSFGLKKNVTAPLQKVVESIDNQIEGFVAGNLQQRGDTENIAVDFKGVVQGINTLVDAMVTPMKDSMNAMKLLSEKDMTVTMGGEYKGEFQEFQNNVNNAISNLRETLEQVRNASEQVSVGGDQVSKSGQTLSQGATEQAASLEEISSSMTEIGSQSDQNAENASQAQNIGTDARASAEDGNKLMKELVTAMGDINESSNTISKIIKVIDEIAFQTNLLALNAAVEAARAGKHGKGFAVVAEEVRNLAARSAKAAKETTEMIEDSLGKVATGTKLAENTDKSLMKIVEGTTKVADIVSEIAAASKEQAKGVFQVVDALSQVDQVTQSNAATAEESASAAEELSSQAAELLDMVAKFKINEEGSTRKVAVATPKKQKQAVAAPAKSKPVVDQNAEIKLDDDDFGKY